MARRKLTTGEKGWIGLVVYVIGVDAIAWANQATNRRRDETMSVAWGRWLQHPASRAGVGIAWGIVSLHLFLSTPLPGEKTLKLVVQGAARRVNRNNRKIRTLEGKKKFSRPVGT